MAKDSLARGAKRAAFAGGVGDIGVDRNLSKEPRMKEPKAAAKKAAVRRQFVPFGETILVRRAIVTKEASIVLTPDTVEQEKPAEGTVLEVGDKVVYAEIGMNVVFGKYAGAEFPINGETLLLMQESELKGKVV